MDKLDLKFKVNNPNSAEDTADKIFKFFIITNKDIVDDVIKEFTDDNEQSVNHSA